MDQQLEKKSASDITKFVESIQSTQDLHFLACHALQKWVDSLADGIPSGYEKLKVWLDIRGDLNGKVSAASGVPELPVPVMTKVKEETVVSKPPPVFLKVTSTTADALSAPSSSDVPPPHSRKRKAPPSELFVSPSISKPNMRLSSVESNENLADRPAMDATASASPIVISNPVSSGLDIWNIPTKKARVESIDGISSPHPAACSESECGPAAISASTVSRAISASNTSSALGGSNASGSDAQGSGAPTSVAGKRLWWTAEMDDRLREAVQLYREDGWKSVAEHFGGEATAKQCQKRYNTVLQYLEQGLVRNEKWSETEIALLKRLVKKHTVASYYSHRRKAMTQERIDWASIGRELGRVPRSCADKWDTAQAVANRAVTEGAIERTGSEYAATASSSTSSSSSSDDESSSGSDSETDSGSGSDSSSSSSSSASSTSSKEHSPGSVPASARGASSEIGTENSSAATSSERMRWTKEEDERLGQLVTLHTIKPYLIEKYNIMSQEHYDWVSIAKELNKTTSKCRDRWRSLEGSKNKMGPFSEEEDILIECCVREWGDKGKGLWVKLEKDLGRPGSTIRRRWLFLRQRTATVVPDGCEK